MSDIHFAWEHRGTAWASAHSTYAAQRNPAGLDFTPYHWASHAAGAALAGQPVRFGSTVISRGVRVLGESSSEVPAQRPRSLAFDRGEVIEELENREDGIEQRWRLPRKPEGRGPLVVSVPVLTGRFVKRTGEGLHFSAGELSVRYGHGTWVDATGLRTAVAASFENGAVVLRVPDSLIERSTFPAVLDPLIGPEFAVDVPVGGPAGGSQQVPAIAHGGGSSLVVWVDQRAGRYDIYAARVTNAGAVLDNTGIAISPTTGPASAFSPAVAWNGTSYLVVWNATDAGNRIVGSRVSATGVLLDSPPLTISTSATGGQTLPCVASDGTNWLVAWEDSRSGNPDIYATRVSAAGSVIDTGGIAVSTLATDQNAPAIAWSGVNYLVTWEDSRNGNSDIFGARINSAGALLDASGVAISNDPARQTATALAWTGSDFLVVWTDARNTSDDIYGARVSENGVLVDATGLRFSSDATFRAMPQLRRCPRSRATAQIAWSAGLTIALPAFQPIARASTELEPCST